MHSQQDIFLTTEGVVDDNNEKTFFKTPIIVN